MLADTVWLTAPLHIYNHIRVVNHLTNSCRISRLSVHIYVTGIAYRRPLGADGIFSRKKINESVNDV